MRLSSLLVPACLLALLVACASEARGPALERPGNRPISMPPESQGLMEDLEAGRYDGLAIVEAPLAEKPQRPSEQALPGCGRLQRVFDDEPGTPRALEDVTLPLERTDVLIDVVGPYASAGVRQRFKNPFRVPIEVAYTFPLPHDAAVHDFVLTIGDRRIRGIVREREEAQRIYQAARRQGYTAALLDQERPNIFTQRVANIAPGRAIDVELAYLEPVDHADGWHELAFPMVVGPRYNPVGAEEPIGAAPRGQGGEASMEYLRPHERSGHDISLEVRLDAGLAVAQIECPTHAVEIDESPTGARVRLSESDSIPNADFRLRWRPAGDGLRTSLVRQGDYALLTLYPPADLAALPRRPIEHVFVLDTSGSMSGEPFAALKRAMRAALQRLDPADTFHVLSFANTVGALDPAPLAATPRNVRRARGWLGRLETGGGTEMLGALEAALARPSDGERPRVVTFLTDGQLSNESEILALIQRRRAEARVFAFSVGSSPNRWLMAEMAKRSGGADASIGLDGDPADAVDAFFARVARPAVRDLDLSFEGTQGSVAADLPRELLIGRPLTVPVKLSGASGPVAVRVRGRVDGAWRELARGEATTLESEPTAPGRNTLAKVWARGTLAQLAAEQRLGDAHEREDLQGRMTALALEHGLVSSYTSFLAVDSAAPVTDGGDPARVNQAVPVPAGQRYDTTVGGGQ